jgi:hypothetical protein
MKMLCAVLLFAAVSPCTAQNPTTVFVASKPTSGAVAVPTAFGPAPMVMTTDGDSARDVTIYLRRNCKAVKTSKSADQADFVLWPAEKRTWNLRDKSGALVFSTHAFKVLNVAKDVCTFLTTSPPQS